MVSMLAFYSDDASLSSADVSVFSVKMTFQKKENEQNEAGFGQVKIHLTERIVDLSEIRTRINRV